MHEHALYIRQALLYQLYLNDFFKCLDLLSEPHKFNILAAVKNRRFTIGRSLPFLLFFCRFEDNLSIFSDDES